MVSTSLRHHCLQCSRGPGTDLPLSLFLSPVHCVLGMAVTHLNNMAGGWGCIRLAELAAKEINVPGSIRITQSYLFPHRVLDHSSLCLWIPSLTSSVLAAGCRPEGQGGLREAMAAAELCPHLTKGPPAPTGLQHPHLVCTGTGGAVGGTGGCSGPSHPASHADVHPAQITVPRMFLQPWSLGRVCVGNTEGPVDQGKSQYPGASFLPTTPVGLEAPSPWGWCEVTGLTGGG